MAKAAPLRSSFNAGEISPLMGGRPDVAKYANGCATLQNFIPTVQGPAMRRAGTRYVAEVKASTDRTWMARFEFNTSQAYVLEFGDQYIRFFTNHGQLLISAPAAYSGATTYAIGDLVSSGGTNYYCKAATTGNAPPNATYWHPLSGTIYEIPTPWAVADLTDATDGTFTLSMAQSGDVVYIAHPSYPLQKLSRLANTKWTMAEAPLANGPFKTQNTDRTITVSASAVSGSVTLTASSGIFSSSMVGSFVYLEPADLAAVKPWTAGQEYAANPLNTYRRSDGKTYICATNATPTASKVYRTGPDKPIHTYGTVADGDYSGLTGTSVERQGLDWTFVDAGYGYAKITGFTSSTQVTATVQGNWSLPIGVVRITQSGTTTSGSASITGLTSTSDMRVGMAVSGAGIPTGTTISAITGSTTLTLSANATASATVSITFGANTFRWSLGAFSGAEGYPSKVCFFRERLTLAKGQQVFFSCSGDFENFASKDDSGQVVADRAIQITISSDQVNTITWLSPTQALLIGTTGGEFVCAENATNEAFAPANVKIEQQTAEGSRAVAPVRVNYSTLMVQRSGRRLREIAYNFQQNGYVSADLTVLAEHITQGGIVHMAWHREPYAVLWCVRGDGTLLGFTFNKEQDVVGWHRHVLGGAFSTGAAVVEAVCVIPAPARDQDELWLIAKRTINGVTRRYVEYLETEYQPGDTQASCFYVDAGATYSGAAATTISGLSYLEGQTVQVLADGAAHPDRTVTAGQITLQVAASTVQVGLGYTSILQPTRIEAGAQDGTAQGKTKRINKAVIRFLYTLGAKAGPSTAILDTLQFRTASDDMDQPPPIFSGDKLMEWPGDYDFDGYMVVQQDQPLPMTVVALMPLVHTFDR